MSRFGMLLRYYRRQSTDPDKGGMLTQERLGELLSREPGNTRYSGAAISDWERSKSEINHNYRSVLVGLIKVLHVCGGIPSLSEANKLLLSGNYRPLNEEETRIILPNGLPAEAINAEASRKEIFLPLLEKMLGSLSELKKDLLGTNNNSGHWSARLLKRIGEVSDRWSLEKILPNLGWIGVWLLTLWLTFPLLKWPFDNQEKALEATLKYVIGALILPLIIGIQTNTRDQEFWQKRQLANSPVLRFFTYIGAAIAFHVGYMMVVAVRLLGYYLGLNSVLQWLSPLAALWPVILGAAAARQVPIDQMKAYGELRFKNGAVFLLFGLFGPIWGTFFYHYSSILLSPTHGFPVVYAAFVSWAILTSWQKRRL